MDNNADLESVIAEEAYLEQYAKFKKGDIVYYQPFNSKEMYIGIIREPRIIHTNITRNGKKRIILTIGYRILSPKNVVTVSECRITSASEWIFREYLMNKQAD